MDSNLRQQFQNQVSFFLEGKTLSHEWRTTALETLDFAVRAFEPRLLEALRKDLGKPSLEAFFGEVQSLYEEIQFTKCRLRRWMRPRRVTSALLSFHATSRILPEPVGPVLILGPWNYPAQLVLAPLIGALAAGNPAIVKPSELAPCTSEVLLELFSKYFPPEHVLCVLGDHTTAQQLLEFPFNHIFFTGSGGVGRKVMEAAAKNLCPVTLELGGKSPCLIAEPVDLEKAIPRIVWGKFFNAGQTCVAPDYLLVPESLRDSVIDGIRATLRTFFGDDAQKSSDYGRIISDRHFERLSKLTVGMQVAVGGRADAKTRFLAPTVVVDPPLTSPLMQDEIFGPILPVVSYHRLEEAIQFVKSRPKPLSLYLFTKDRETERLVLRDVSFGGGCVNDTLVHLGNPRLPFGGVGESGMGRYHGKYSFETFTHYKTVVRRSVHFDWSLRFPPYGNRLERLRKWF